jgi:HPt (histidine-containing phosphotransfer) domain-containing protein
MNQQSDQQSDQQEEVVKSSTPTTWVVRPDPDLADLIPSFVQNRRNELAELQVAHAKADFEFVCRIAHTWKGICRPYGFNHLETLAKSLEEAGERESASDVAGVMAEMTLYLDHVRIVYDS